MAAVSLSNIDAFKIIGDGGISCIGGNQRWFSGSFKRDAGCGPTTFSNIIAYYSKIREDCRGLNPYDSGKKTGFSELMEDVIGYVTPTMVGTMPDTFVTGANKYAASKGYRFDVSQLSALGPKIRRPTPGEVSKFIENALNSDDPVAFLNLSNGHVKNLDRYHWVTIVSFDEATGEIEIVDNGLRKTVDVIQWLQKSTMGGSFVRISPHVLV